VVQLVALGTQTGLDVSETLPIGELGERHRQVLVEATEPPHFVVASVASDAAVKGVKEKVIHDLAEDQFS
jgi:hypothetical protein